MQTDQLPFRVPQQARSHVRVRQILQSATALIRLNGCAGLTVSDIARGAGITSGSVYQYFPGRGAIIAELAEQYRTGNQRTVSSSLSAVENDVPGIGVSLLEAYCELQKEHPIARDIVMGMTMDKQLRLMGKYYVQDHVEFVLSRVKHLFHREQHDSVKQVILLSMHCGAATVECINTLDKDQGLAAMALARAMLRTSWTCTIGEVSYNNRLA